MLGRRQLALLKWRRGRYRVGAKVDEGRRGDGDIRERVQARGTRGKDSLDLAKAIGR